MILYFSLSISLTYQSFLLIYESLILGWNPNKDNYIAIKIYIHYIYCNIYKYIPMVKRNSI